MAIEQSHLVEYKNCIKTILNYRLGSKYRLLAFFIVLPILGWFVDNFEYWYVNKVIKIEFSIYILVFSEALTFLMILIRFIRDFHLNKTIYPVGENSKQIKKAIEKIKKMKNKHGTDKEYLDALNTIQMRNEKMMRKLL